MKVPVTCSHCGLAFKVDGQYVGKRGKCPNPECRQSYIVPDPELDLPEPPTISRKAGTGPSKSLGWGESLGGKKSRSQKGSTSWMSRLDRPSFLMGLGVSAFLALMAAVIWPLIGAKNSSVAAQNPVAGQNNLAGQNPGAVDQATASGFASKVTPFTAKYCVSCHGAEKPEAGDGLAPQGEKRAQAYVNYFKSYQIGGKPAKFSHLFAASDSAKSHRPRLTIEPFANATHSKIDLRFSDKEPDVFAKDLTTHDYGTAILVSWRHGKIPDLLKAIGADPKKLVPEGDWPDSVFDRVVELHFDAHGKIDEKTSRVVLEHLLPGDEKTVGH